MEFKAKLIEKRDEAKGTKTFFFEKPIGFEYKAGQYCYFTIPELKYPDQRGNIRHFTLSSSPTQPNITITCRMREESGFKKTLDKLEIGEVIDVRGPSGTFCFEDHSAGSGQAGHQIMIAGGIGITPFHSIIKYVSDKNLPLSITLIYSNSIPEEITFKDEFDQITNSHPNIKVVYTVTKPEESKLPWNGEIGRIDEKLLKMETGKLKTENCTFWVCGPPPMVDALEETLANMNIPQEQILSEKFTGY